MKKLERIETNKGDNGNEYELNRIFNTLSQEKTGLSCIDKINDLHELSLSRDNLDDLIYTFKFIDDTNFFINIINNNGEGLHKLNPQERKRAVNSAKIFYATLVNPPVINEISFLKPKQIGLFISHIFVNETTRNYNDSKIYITWKEESELEEDIINKNPGMFDMLLQKYNKKAYEFPPMLRNGGLILLNDDPESLYITFDGNSSVNGSYFPTLLKNKEEDIRDVFLEKSYTQEKSIFIQY